MHKGRAPLRPRVGALVLTAVHQHSSVDTINEPGYRALVEAFDLGKRAITRRFSRWLQAVLVECRFLAEEGYTLYAVIGRTRAGWVADI